MLGFKESAAYTMIKNKIEEKKMEIFKRFMADIRKEKYDKEYTEQHLQQAQFLGMDLWDSIVEDIITENMPSFAT